MVGGDAQPQEPGVDHPSTSNHFKKINDRYGHPAGGQRVVDIAIVLRANCRVSDFLFPDWWRGISDITRVIRGGTHVAEKIRSTSNTNPTAMPSTVYL